MAVVAGELLYDVANPLRPRLVCRGTDTRIRLLDGNAIAYTTVVAGKVVIVRRDLATGTETRVAHLRVSPQPYYYAAATWTSDGLYEVFSTAGATGANGLWKMQIHLSLNGADHVLYTIDAGPGGAEGRWAGSSTLEISPDRAYIAVSDANFSLFSKSFRIFATSDLRQTYVTATTAFGGTWEAGGRFIWATASGSVMQWTPAGGATMLRSERWFGPSTSAGREWLAATLLTDYSKPRVVIAAVGGSRTFVTGPGSSPGFVTSTVAWYAEEAPCPPNDQCGYDPTGPSRTVRAFDVTNGSDQVVVFRAGEEPITNGYNFCCAPRI